MDWYLKVLKNYTQFSGRARRKEYWMFVLINFGISIVLSIIDTYTGIGFLSLVYFLAIIIPSLAVSVRRLHDIGKDWIWLLLAFIPIIGAIWLIVLLAKEGTIGANAFGEDPKAEENGTYFNN